MHSPSLRVDVGTGRTTGQRTGHDENRMPPLQAVYYFYASAGYAHTALQAVLYVHSLRRRKSNTIIFIHIGLRQSVQNSSIVATA